MTTTLRRLVPMAVLALVATACTGILGGNGPTMVSATFDDVIDLVKDGSVRMNDLQVGTIEAIELTEDNRARVTMALEPEAEVPQEVRAVLAKTSVLGERYVALEPTGEDASCCIEDGTEIADTEVRGDLEDLVAAGSDLLVSVSSDAVRQTIEVAAETFGGREQLIGAFIDDVNGLVGTYQDNTDELLALIDALDRVTAAYAPNAADNAAVLEDLRVAAAALEDIDEDLLNTLDDVTELSDEAVTFLSEHQDQLQDTLRRLRKVTQQVAAADADVDRLLEVGPLYTLQLTRGALNEEAQVWLDFIVCGVNDTNGDPSRDCTPPNPGERAEGPPFYPVPRECWEDPDPCTEDGEG